MNKNISFMISDNEGFIHEQRDNCSILDLIRLCYQTCNNGMLECFKNLFNGYLRIEVYYQVENKDYKKDLYIGFSQDTKLELGNIIASNLTLLINSIRKDLGIL